MSRWHAAWAWLGGAEPVANVLIEVADGRFSRITADAPRPVDAVALAGLTLPGLANAHSHAFHRALRGRTNTGRGSFFTWREQMYAVAERLTPDSYLALARATYAEMVLAGVTCVAEFHYLHHAPGGTAYADPNVMSAALARAAAEAGLRITLLDTCYLTGSVAGAALVGAQQRFGDTSAERWASRASSFKADGEHARFGAAIHSVRAVPADQVPTVVEWAADRGTPLHVHLSEQRAENEDCLAHYGRTPTAVLADAGALGPRTTAVHATHLSEHDRMTLGGSGAGACLCPTTERDLGDGLGTARALLDAGAPLSLGSDSHAVIDLLTEARELEMHERLRTRERGHFTAADLLHAATRAGHLAAGWPDAGRIAVGARADLVTVDLDSVRTAGVPPAQVIFAATADDVRHVVVDGRVTVSDGRHVTLDVPAALAAAIQAVTA